MSKDYSAAADWAERDMTLPRDCTSARRGQAAADFGRDLLAKAGGRPPLLDDQRLAATVQVRLTAAEKRELADLAARSLVLSSPPPATTHLRRARIPVDLMGDLP